MPAIYGVVAVALVVAVVAVAYGTAAPQLGVAEFAPAARQAVEPPTTAAAIGGQAGASGHRSPHTTQPPSTTGPSAPENTGSGAAPTTVVTRSRACVGNPPRQTEDPQSPPCVGTIFEGDNGGATSTGVTGTEIAVAVPLTSDDANMKGLVEAQFEYFNQRYEFYGRRLRPIFSVGGASDPVASRSLAAGLAANQAFAALTFQIEGSGQPHLAFYQEAARQGMITVATDSTRLLSDSVVYDTYDPYIWSVYASVEQRYRAAADLVCSSLAGRPARHAGTGTVGATRRFAIIASADQSIPSTHQLEDAVSACGPLAPTVKLTTADIGQGGARTALERMKADGVTTILCVCGGSAFPGSYFGDASAVKFFPEWIPLFYFASDEFFGNFVTPTADGDQLANVLMMTGASKTAPLQSRPSFNAVMATRPDLFEKAVSTVTGTGDRLYKQLLVLTAGIQGAGPALTAHSFGQALMTMQFPNPNAGHGPDWQQAVGFGPGDHSLYDDFTLAWWNRQVEPLNPAAPAGKGSWCYVDQGARYRPGTFPADADAKYFDTTQPCR